MKIIFFGTSNVALPILEALSKHHEIVAVVTMPDAPVGRSQSLTESPVSVLANEMKLKILKPEKVKGNQEFLSQLQNFVSPPPRLPPQGGGIKKEFPPLDGEGWGGVELFVVVSYGKILPLEIINLPKFKTINVHFSLLPKYRGPSPIQSALLNGESKSGTSIFILDELVDHGPVLSTLEVAIDGDDNALSLSQKMAFASAKLIVSTLEDYIQGGTTPKEQDHSQASFTEHIDKAHGKIDWSKSARQIYNQFRAFYPWPGIWTTWKGKKVKILDCITTELQKGGTTDTYGYGQVLDGGIVVCGSDSFLQIKTLQMEGKKATKISDFLNGNKEFVGGVLV